VVRGSLAAAAAAAARRRPALVDEAAREDVDVSRKGLLLQGNRGPTQCPLPVQLPRVPCASSALGLGDELRARAAHAPASS